MPDRLRIVLAEDNYLVREGTKRLLEDSGEVVIEAAVEDAPQLIDAVERLAPDVVITDIRMPPNHHMEGISAAHDIRQRSPSTGVVVLSQHVDEAYAFELLKHGTTGLGYLLKDRVGDLDELLRAVRTVHAGGSVIDPQVVEKLVARRARVAESAVAKLTPRETDVLREMAQGKTNAAIASTLSLSDSAIEKHINVIFQKLGLTEEASVNKRVSAVLAFLRDPQRLVGTPAPPNDQLEGAGRILASLLFTDIVQSSNKAAAVGDARWRGLLDQHHRAVRAQLTRFGGREVKTTGDGFLALFDRPARAIHCACGILRELETLGLEARASVHAGEVEVSESDVVGIAVHVAARIMALAGPGEVCVSGAVPPLVAGSRIRFAPRGEHILQGIPEPWAILLVDYCEADTSE